MEGLWWGRVRRPSKSRIQMLRGGVGGAAYCRRSLPSVFRESLGKPVQHWELLTSQSPNPICARKAAGAQLGSPGTNSAEAGLRRRRRRRRRAPTSSAAPWRIWGNGLGTAVPQHTRGRPGGRARRSLRAGILPPTPRPPAPLPLDCGRRKPLHERAPARARARPARRRPDSGGAWTRGLCSCGGGPHRARAPDVCQGVGGGHGQD